MSNSTGKDITTVQWEEVTYVPPLGMTITSTSLVLTDSAGTHLATFQDLSEAAKCLLGNGMSKDVVDHVVTQTKAIQERAEVGEPVEAVGRVFRSRG